MAIIREATSVDVAIHGSQITAGLDLIVQGAGGVGTYAGDVFRSSVLDQGVAIRADQKVFIDGRWHYGKIQLYWDGADALTVEGGSGTLPVTFTNIGGQAVVSSVAIGGLKNFRVTGKYDPVLGTGNLNYQGCDATGGLATAAGKYGIFISPGWGELGQVGLGVFRDLYGDTDQPSSDFEIDYIEAGAGGFAGFQFKNDHISDADGGTMRNVHVHHCYIHDCGGEGIYSGHTNANGDLEHSIQIHCHDVYITRTGREGFQFGRLMSGTIIENVNCYMAGINWMLSNPDGGWNFQDKNTQFGFRNGNIVVRNSTFHYAGSHTVFIQVDGSGDDRVTSDLAWNAQTAGDDSGHILFENVFIGGSRKELVYIQKSFNIPHTIDDVPYAIDSVDTGSDIFRFNGTDVTAYFPDGVTFKITGSTGNDGTYTVQSTAFTGGNTEVTVVEEIPDGTADGTIRVDCFIYAGKDVSARFPDSGDFSVSSSTGNNGDYTVDSVVVVDDNTLVFPNEAIPAIVQNGQMNVSLEADAPDHWITIKDSFFGGVDYQYDDLDSSDTDSGYYINGNNDLTYIRLVDNTKDELDGNRTLVGPFSPASARITEVGTVSDAAMEYPVYENSSFDDANNEGQNVERWSEFIAQQGGGYTSNYRAYAVDDVIQMYGNEGVMKKCIQAHDGSNSAVTHPITGSSTDSYWEDYDLPKDDMRTKKESTYHDLGIGLSSDLDSPDVVTRNEPYEAAKRQNNFW